MWITNYRLNITNLLSRSPITLLLLFWSLLLFGQNEVRFQAFGKTPLLINDSLYKKLRTLKNLDEKSNLLFEIGEQHFTYGDADSVLHYAKLLHEIQLKNKAFTTVHKIKYKKLLGDGNLLLGLNNESLKNYLEGIELSQKIDKKPKIDWLNLRLGQVYYQKKEFKKAKTSLNALLKNSNDTIAAKSRIYLAQIALTKEDFNGAVKLLKDASVIIATKELTKTKLKIQLVLSQISLKKGEYDDAFEGFEYVLQKTHSLNYFDLYTEAVLGYGEVARALERYEVAEITLAMAYSNSMQWNRLELQKKIINSLQLTYQKKDDFENAYNLMTQYVSVSNQILQRQNNRAIKEFETKYQTLEKENQIFELKQAQFSKQVEIERQKTIKKAFLFGFLAVLIPILALLFVYYQKLQTQSQLNQQQKEFNEQKIASLLNEQELVLARTSLAAQQDERKRIANQLHDSIGGNLAGIKLQLNNLGEKKSLKKELMAQVNETYELVREISHNLTPKKFNQNNFSLLIKDHLTQLSNNSDLQINFSSHPEEKINQLNEKFKIEIYQIIQELLTNTIKHAKAKSLEVHINIIDGIFQLIFEDDGQGFEKQKTNKGFGIKNLENRLTNLNGMLHIDSVMNRGTVVSIEIPLNIEN